MRAPGLTSAERLGAALGHREADRVPLLLLVTMHGARALGLSIREYFASAEAVAEAQLRMQARWRHDCLYAFFYAALELEAWGGETVHREDGPPNAGGPIARRAEDILALAPPRVDDARCLRRVLEAISILRARSRGVPIIGVVMAPFSLPVMQLGFDRYLEVMHERPDLLERLLAVNEQFCVEWGNAQLRAGASALCYFDPCCSPTVTTPDLARRYAFPVARRTISRFEGPAVTHLASGRCLPIVEDLRATGAAAIGVSALEDLGELRSACRGRVAMLGNLNGVEMRRWDAAQAEVAVKEALALGAPGGGFVLSDAHGEIPFQVPEAVLDAISSAVHRWGTYPLTWAEEERP
jgi:uroporphyrinogen decarboxylase